MKNHEIDPEKLNKIKQMPLSVLKEKLGLEEIDVSIEIHGINGEKIIEKKELNKGKESTQVTRTALMKGEIIVLTIKSQ